MNMTIELEIETKPDSFDAEADISNALQDGRLRRDVERAIEREIEAIMHWRDMRVTARLK